MKVLLDLGFKVPYATAKYPVNLNYIKKGKQQKSWGQRWSVLFSQAIHST